MIRVVDHDGNKIKNSLKWKKLLLRLNYIKHDKARRLSNQYQQSQQQVF